MDAHKTLGCSVALAAVGLVACARPPLIFNDNRPVPVVAPPPEPVLVQPDPVALPAPVRFATASAIFAPDAEEILRVVVEHLRRSPETTLLRVEGHTDNVGGTEANQKLSEERALAVAAWLVAHGVECRRLLPVGYGETKPVASNDTDTGRAQNRRIVFVAAALGGRNIDAEPARGGHVAGELCAGNTTLAGPNPFKPAQTWSGSYKCSAGQTQLRVKIEGVQGAAVSAIFDFGAVAGAAGASHGAYHISGTYDASTRKIELKPGDWIEHPPLGKLLGMIGEVTADGGQFFGSITSPGCSQFSVNLQK